MLQPQKKNISAEEYLEMEKTAEYKNEYFQGEIFAMTGASFNHNLIVSNIIIALGSRLRNSSCFIFSGDMKIQVDEAMHYTYPDVSIVCGDIEFVGGRDDVITNPVVIFEVLSNSTKDYDRGSKFTAYRNIRSLKDYILIDQYDYHAEYFYKNEQKRWILEEFRSPGDTLKISSVAAELSLDTIYDRVRWQT
ncbi:Uma2 family endonuclease [Desulfonema magnum]|uniref:DUF820 n=1 Tax=Desulfonema magnum TaxID=45655 RepID=A0A975GU73_9BACT|nr:Uma2 family endonuclease [Desulfonema magnum]QTA93791.1 DUF820 [Desulfonema magnum]